MHVGYIIMKIATIWYRSSYFNPIVLKFQITIGKILLLYLYAFYLYWIQMIIIFCDHENDDYTTGLVDIWSKGLDKPSLGKTDRTVP
jgi:hypothetical protein